VTSTLWELHEKFALVFFFEIKKVMLQVRLGQEYFRKKKKKGKLGKIQDYSRMFYFQHGFFSKSNNDHSIDFVLKLNIIVPWQLQH
jgi:hypothetical protein